MNFFNTITSRLVGGLDVNSMTYINQSNVPVTYDPSGGTDLVDYNDVSYGSTAIGLNINDTNTTFASLEKQNNGALIQTSDLLQDPFKGFSVYMKYKLRDNSSNQVFSQYGASNPVVQLYSSHTEINRGDQLQITVFQNGYTDLSYVITGVTSANLNGADLSGTISDLYTVLSYDIQPGIEGGTLVFVAGDASLNISTFPTYFVKTVQNALGQTVFALKGPGQSEFLVKPNLSFGAGDMFMFDVSDPTMNGFNLVFGTTLDVSSSIVTEYVSGSGTELILDIPGDYSGNALVYFESSIAGMGPDPEFVNTSVLGDWATYSGNSFTLTGSAYPFANGNYSLSQSVPSANYSNNLHRIILLETGTQADWHSELQSYNSTSGDYTANRSEEVTLGYNGCWVEITMPYKLQISQVSIRGRFINGTPKLAYLFGSNDGNQYNFIGQLNFIGTDELQSTSVSSTTGYKVVRMVVNKVHPSSGTTSLDYWELKGIPYPPIEYLVRKHTTNTTYEMSTDGGSTWTEKPRITFEANQPYKFDQSNSTNSGEQIVFGTTFDDKANVLGAADGVTVVGTPGQPGAYTQLVLGASFSGDLYYYSAGSNGMGYVPFSYLYDSNISTDPKTISQTLDFSSDFTLEIQFTPYSNTGGWQILFANSENLWGTDGHLAIYLYNDEIILFAKDKENLLSANPVLNENNTLLFTRTGNNISYMLNNVSVSSTNSGSVEYLANFTNSLWAVGGYPAEMNPSTTTRYITNGMITTVKKDGVALSVDI